MKVFLCLFSFAFLVMTMTYCQTIVKDICRQGSGSSKCSKSNTYTWNSIMNKCRAVRPKTGPCGFFHYMDRCNEICSKEDMSNDELEQFIQKYAV